MVEDSRAERDQRLQSARKKLKSYRAKQAQMEKAKRTSTISNSGSNVSSSSVSVSPSRLVGSVLNEASLESQVAMAGGSNKRASMRLSISAEKRHSRTISRSGAGHGRGHSRNGSISISQVALAGGVAAAALDHLNQRNSATILRPTSSHFANTAHSHTRGHSRSGSRSLAANSRPTSFIGSQPLSDQGMWRDENIPLVNEDLFKTPTMSSDTAYFSSSETDATPQPKPVRQNFVAPVTTITQATPIASSNHARKPSRHSRKGSVSTRRESMELMGGLGSLIDTTSDSSTTAKRQSRRNSAYRLSGLQSASVLFGVMPDLVNNIDKKKEVEADASEDEGGDRFTALEKLEGKNRREVKSSSVQLPSFDEVHGDEGMDKRASLTLLESNVQTTSNERPANVVPPSRPQTLLEPLNEDVLGTLMEEEEEEEEAALFTPVKERGRFDFIDEMEKRKRKEAEQEVIKRTRRGSLTPRPLKLKSRPASLFVASRSTLMITSPSLPVLDQIEEVEAASAAAVDAGLSTAISLTPASTSLHNLTLPTTEQEARLPPLVTPSRDTKRAWRSSMPLSAPLPTLQQNSVSPSKSPSGGSISRQGMKVLRLGSTSASNSPSAVQQHKNRTDSTSSFTSTASNSSANLSKRGSLLYSMTPNTSVSMASREESSPLAKKRGSFIYKSSPLDGAANASSDDHSTASSMQHTPASAPASHTSTSIGGVPMSLFEELKSKHQRDVGLLDEARTKIARLEIEMSREGERIHQEIAAMERWSVEEKKMLGQRIESLEASIVEVVQVREAQEQDHFEEKSRFENDNARLQTELEDIEAERDMLRDDVEGWRMRCSGLERSVRAEKQQGVEEVRRVKAASKARIKELLQKLHENNIKVERRSIDDEELSVELVAILCSPLVGPSSPKLNAPRDRSTSPNHGDLAQLPPSQAVQLLKEMRQQIFNLAGSLDHERKQHMLSRQEVDDLKVELAAAASDFRDESLNDMTTTTVDSHFFSPEKGREEGDVSTEAVPSASTPPQASDRQSFTSSGKGGKKKRNHVFAYDSSMESGCDGTSLGSASITTNQTSEMHHDESEGEEMFSKNNEDFVAQVQADLVGLGMSQLGTLDEEEEAAASELDDQSSTPLHHSDTRLVEHDLDVDAQRDSFDIESGRRTSDVESVTPSTPALDHHNTAPLHGEGTCIVTTQASTVSPLPLDHILGASNSSSNESDGPPTPFVSAAVPSSQDTMTEAMESSQQDEYYTSSYDETTYKKARPEFIREWSFNQATAAIKTRTGSAPSPSNGETARFMTKKVKDRKMSIEDFFGIMSLDDSQRLPALPTPEEALEMPPLYIEPYSGRISQINYGNLERQNRFPSQIRPPVPRASLTYARSSSNSDRSSSSSSRNSSNHQLSAQSPYKSSGIVDGGGLRRENSSTQLAPAGGMFSRVASLTSAFSGLGGYLIGTSSLPGAGMATNAVVAASRVCNPDNDDYESRDADLSWSVRRQDEEMA
ncbi:hypothetical protein CBS101457_001691 [Exobasidium rhododendri]|nr:hypothetical protein CBS101457_001691 [Exobasidium rhododendri]